MLPYVLLSFTNYKTILIKIDLMNSLIMLQKGFCFAIWGSVVVDDVFVVLLYCFRRFLYCQC